MLKQKLRSAKGETLVETLCAVLVCGVSIMLLVGMVTTAMRINRSVRELDMGADGSSGFYGALSAAETYQFTDADAAFTVKVSGAEEGEIALSDVRGVTQGSGAFSLTVYGKGG